LKSVAALLSFGSTALADRSSSPRTDASLLLAHVLGHDGAWIVAHGDASPSEEETRAFARLCERRRAGTPIAYLVGYAGFYGRDFIVNENVLVPRPETEHLVDDVARSLRASARVLDVGAGCGAIACTIAAQTPAFVDGTDRSAAAIAVAKENARRLGVADRCRFHHGDLTGPVRSQRFDAVVANLPYIPTSDLPQPPDPASFEPRIALDGGPDGLSLYRRLLAELPPLLNDDALLLFEAAPPTIDKLADLVQRTFPHFTISIGHDYANLPRYVRAENT